jgi:transforming growth factor-beta-induced protein
MKLFLAISALVAVAIAAPFETQVADEFSFKWFEQEAAKSAQDPEFLNLPDFLTADEDISQDFGQANFGEPRNVLQVAKDNGATIFVKAAHFAGVADTFMNTQDITVFVPNNAAFLRLPHSVMMYFMMHRDRLAELLRYHAVKGTFNIGQLTDDQTYPTLMTRANWTLRYDAYTHASYNYTTNIVQASRISEKHRDLAATNGVVQIIDEVILKFPVFTAYDIISRSTHFSTLYNGLIVAGMDQSLKGAGPLTLFAPTEEAFKRLPPGVWEALLKDVGKLTAVLDMHVASKTYYARGFRDMDTISTLNKNAGLTVHIRPGKEEAVSRPHPERVEVEVNDARIIYFDGATSNGNIQVIDTVLIPPSIKKEFNMV